MTRAELIAALDAAGCKDDESPVICIADDSEDVCYQISGVQLWLPHDSDLEEIVIIAEVIN